VTAQTVTVAFPNVPTYLRPYLTDNVVLTNNISFITTEAIFCLYKQDWNGDGITVVHNGNLQIWDMQKT